ncbi:hypothetical protein [Paenibacillus segetis]|uniref:Uncharacterized protein n=1 Tax=Paenibacillus segetis TaxID=1325360 RepID=A0ABQ1YAH2_9BACL|nr:hypothetical protein [Paenibacillus segetis]GGH18819.1 hypothetical protein GCM10008013_15050 [Paenibacillus segetis]
MLVNIECPIEFLDYKFYKSKSTGQVYCSLTFNNLTNKLIKGLKATIYCYDQFGDAVVEGNNRVECKIDFNDGLARNQRTDKKVLLSEFPNTRKIEIDILKVLYDDKTIWSKDTTELEKVDLIKIENPRLLEFVKLRAGEDAIYLARKYEHRWICLCGRLNHEHQFNCLRCSREKIDALTNYSDEEKISNDLKAHEEHTSEEQRLIMEKSERQREITKHKVKKLTKYCSIAVAILLITGIVIYGFMTKFTFSRGDNETLVEDVVVDQQVNERDYPLAEDWIVDTTFVEVEGEKGLGEFTINYRKDGIVKSKIISNIIRPEIIDIDNNGLSEVVFKHAIELPEIFYAETLYWEDVYDFDMATEELYFESVRYPDYYKDYFIPANNLLLAECNNSAEKQAYGVLLQAAEDLINGNFTPDQNHQRITNLIDANILANKLKITRIKDKFYVYGITYDMEISKAIEILGDPDESFEVDSKVAIWYLDNDLELYVEYYSDEPIFYIALGEFDKMIKQEVINMLGGTLEHEQDGNIEYDYYLTPSQYLSFGIMPKEGRFRIQIMNPDVIYATGGSHQFYTMK